MDHPYNNRYYLYTISLGAGSFLLLLWLTFGAGETVHLEWVPLLLFTALAFVSKFLSFQMGGVVSLSMDTAVYITAILSLGTLPGAWTVFFSMYLKILWDTLDREVLKKSEHRPFLENLTAPLFQGATGALITLVAGTLLPVRAFVEGTLDREMHVAWLAFALAALFVCLQYTVVLNKYWLRGYSWNHLFRRVFLPGIRAELVLIPLAIVMALAYHTQGHVGLPLLFLVATYIIVNFIFKKMSDARTRLGEKVRDLENLNELGRVVCSNLQAGDLVPALAGQTLSVLPHTDAILVHVWDDEHGRFDSHVECRQGFDSADFDEETAIALASWAAREARPFNSATASSRHGAAHLDSIGGRDLTGHSWAGVPVDVNDQVIGVLVLYARRPGRFTSADLGLLQMIGRQAAVALQNSRLYILATIDGLTRLFVRRYFDRRLLEEVARSRRYGTSFSLMLIDFDDFKVINDTYGHAVGDQVLREVADIILSEARSMDIPARYGGDEFAIILPEVNWRGAIHLASRILYRTRRDRVRVGDHLIAFSLSMGLASFPEHADEGVREILSAADQALYEAKARGKCRLAVFGEEPSEEVVFDE